MRGNSPSSINLHAIIVIEPLSMSTPTEALIESNAAYAYDF
jgi:hypothetical protein